MAEQRASAQTGKAFGPIHAFMVVFVASAGCLFFYKLYAFLSTIRRDELAGFAFDPIITYAFVAIGFLFLLLWAWISGQFRDVERPKLDMLARFEEQERAEGIWRDWGVGTPIEPAPAAPGTPAASVEPSEEVSS